MIKILKDNKCVIIDEPSNELEIYKPTVNRHLKSLTESNRIVRVGSRKTGFWQVNQ